MTSASQPDPGDDRDGGLPPELEKLFKDLTGGAEIPPEVRQMLAGSGLGALDPTVMASMAEQMKAMFSDEGGQDGFDDERATTIARQVSSAAGDPVVTERATTTVREAVRTADLWLDEVTDLAATGVDRPGLEPSGVGRGDHAALGRPGRARGRRCVPRGGRGHGQAIGSSG